MKYIFTLLFILFFVGCSSDREYLEGFYKPASFGELKENQLYFVLYESKSYCPYCEKQKRVLFENNYVNKYTQYTFLATDASDSFYKEITSFKGLDNDNNYFPLMYIFKIENGSINVLEEYTGFTDWDVLHYTLERNLNLE